MENPTRAFVLKRFSELLELPEEQKIHNDLRKQVLVNEAKNQDGLFKCGRCRSMKTSYYEMQTRSADEPMTVFVSCLNCGKNWKC
jgi:DNA-directed RNA polymerase subunit M/transcription elongation factor TFIIS